MKLDAAYNRSTVAHYLGSLMLLLLALTPIPAEALDPNIDVSQYAHAGMGESRTETPAAPRGPLPKLPMAISGLGTGSGLLRFDGSRFATVDISLTRSVYRPTEIFSLLGARDGSLWIRERGQV